MAINNSPPFVNRPILGPPVLLTAANTTKDGTTLTVAANLIHTAGPDGSYIETIMCRALGTNVASLLRVFYVTTGTGDPTVAANNGLLVEWNMPVTTTSETTAIQPIDIPVFKGLPAGCRLFATLATAVAAGWEVTAYGGDFSV